MTLRKGIIAFSSLLAISIGILGLSRLCSAICEPCSVPSGSKCDGFGIVETTCASFLNQGCTGFQVTKAHYANWVDNCPQGFFTLNPPEGDEWYCKRREGCRAFQNPWTGEWYCDVDPMVTIVYEDKVDGVRDTDGLCDLRQP